MRVKPFTERQAASDKLIHPNPLLNRVYQNRGITSTQEIQYSLGRLLDPQQMLGMQAGCEILINHIRADSRIVIIGDYDCDGATSTSIAVEGLRMLGAKNVDFLVPDRIKHGYGLSPAIVEIAAKRLPDLIVTVDNGIAAFEGAQAVRKLKRPCQLLITDHHLASTQGLPCADAIINPNQPLCEFASKNIAGCGVMFYLIMGLRTMMRERGVFAQIGIDEPSLAPLLDLVALGTVADVVKLDYNNRILVSAGLKWINDGWCRPGLAKILELKKREIGKIVASDFGFSAGPCINAAGRLDDMTVGIRCLLAKSEQQNEALELAQQLFDLNETRKGLEATMVAGALECIESLDANKDGIVVYNAQWHEGVVGIVASRIKDRFDRPVIVFTDTHDLLDAKSALHQAIASGASEQQILQHQVRIDECEIKGSARSIAGIHLKHLLDEMSKSHPQILTKFGGHAMAAGVSIRSDKFHEFCDLFDRMVARQMSEQMRVGQVQVDVADIAPELLTIDNARAIAAQPVWGQGFEAPLFSQRFEVLEKRVLKEKHLKLKLRIPGSDRVFDAIAFGCVDRGVLPVDGWAQISFRLDINEWRGNSTLQLMIDHIQEPEADIIKELIGPPGGSPSDPPEGSGYFGGAEAAL